MTHTTSPPDHHTGVHQESRRRLAVLCGQTGVLRSDRYREAEWLDPQELKKASMGDILRVHDHAYVTHLKENCANLPPQKTKELHVSAGTGDDISLAMGKINI